MSYLAEDFDEIKDLRDQHLKNHPSFEAQNLLTGHVFEKVPRKYPKIALRVSTRALVEF